jgi:hypothetical protein
LNDNHTGEMGISQHLMQEAQAVLDREQPKFLGGDPSSARLSAWFNACMNSGVGPIAVAYGDLAVATLLNTWLVRVREKIAKDAAAMSAPEFQSQAADPPEQMS